jgi:hypothetical protein
VTIGANQIGESTQTEVQTEKNEIVQAGENGEALLVVDRAQYWVSLHTFAGKVMQGWSTRLGISSGVMRVVAFQLVYPLKFVVLVVAVVEVGTVILTVKVTVTVIVILTVIVIVIVVGVGVELVLEVRDT